MFKIKSEQDEDKDEDNKPEEKTTLSQRKNTENLKEENGVNQDETISIFGGYKLDSFGERKSDLATNKKVINQSLVRNLFGNSKSSTDQNSDQKSSNLFGGSKSSVGEKSLNLFGGSKSSVDEKSSNLFGETKFSVDEKSLNLFGESKSSVDEKLSNIFGESKSSVDEKSSNIFGGSESSVDEKSLNLFGGSKSSQDQNSTQKSSNIFGESKSSVGEKSPNIFGESKSSVGEKSPNIFGESKPSKDQNSAQNQFGPKNSGTTKVNEDFEKNTICKNNLPNENDIKFGLYDRILPEIQNKMNEKTEFTDSIESLFNPDSRTKQKAKPQSIYQRDKRLDEVDRNHHANVSEITAQARHRFSKIFPKSPRNINQTYVYDHSQGKTPKNICPPSVDLSKWHEGIFNNPDPQAYSTVHIGSFDQLKERALLQNIFHKMCLSQSEAIESEFQKHENSLQKQSESSADKLAKDFDGISQRVIRCIAAKEKADTEQSLIPVPIESAFQTQLSACNHHLEKSSRLIKNLTVLQRDIFETTLSLTDNEEKNKIVEEGDKMNEREMEALTMAISRTQFAMDKIEESLTKSSVIIEKIMAKIIE